MVNALLRLTSFYQGTVCLSSRERHGPRNVKHEEGFFLADACGSGAKSPSQAMRFDLHASIYKPPARSDRMVGIV